MERKAEQGAPSARWTPWGTQDKEATTIFTNGEGFVVRVPSKYARWGEELFDALKWALTYGTFAAATDSPLHGRMLDFARDTIRKVEASNG